MSKQLGTNRREFLTCGLPDGSETGRCVEFDAFIDPVSHQTAYFEHYRKSAMACEFELFFNLHQYRLAAESSVSAFDLIDRYENQLSVFRKNSELSQINSSAFQEPVNVEPQLFYLLSLADKIFQETSGAFDITSGPLSAVWGFSQRRGRLPDSSEIDKELERVSMDFVDLKQPNTIRFKHAGVRLNLGAIGKGFALDKAAALIIKNKINDFVFHGGQSSVVARGNCVEGKSGEFEARPGWTIGLSHPTIPSCRLAEIRLMNTALATSGTGRQGFFCNGKRFGHIIDPRTGWPADQFLASTVICESAAEADALATAFFVMTIDEVRQFCDKHKRIKAILVVNDKEQNSGRLESFNMDSEDWTIL